MTTEDRQADRVALVPHIEYEVIMLLGALEELATRPDWLPYECDDSYRIECSALLESFLLHARVLDDFLRFPAGTEHLRADDVVAQHYLIGWKAESSIDCIDAPQGYEKLRDAINKQLAHISTFRAGRQDFDVPTIARKLTGALTSFVGDASNLCYEEFSSLRTRLLSPLPEMIDEQEFGS